jgi:hypothetical protein
MQKAIDYSTGDIALHAVANNSVKHLYEKIGFTNPYLEMRLKTEYRYAYSRFLDLDSAFKPLHL